MESQSPLERLSDAERFLADLCPYCGASRHEVALEGRDQLFPQPLRYRILSCSECGGWFTQGAGFPGLDDYYSKAYPDAYYQTVMGGETYGAGSNPYIRDVLLRHLKNPAQAEVLDVGCSDGSFMNHLREKGFRVQGVEIGKVACETCRGTYGIDVFNGSVEDFKPGIQFDAISLVGTIEHLMNPVRTLKAIRRLLKNDGILVFDYPNVDSLAFKLARARWWALELPRHTLHLTPRSASRVVEQAGLTVKESIFRPQTWFHAGFLNPPVADGYRRFSLMGMTILATSAVLRLAGASSLVISVCTPRPGA